MAERHRSKRDLFRDKIAQWISAGWMNNHIIQELAKFDVKLSKSALSPYVHRHGRKAKPAMPPDTDPSDSLTDTDDRSNFLDNHNLPPVSGVSESTPPLADESEEMVLTERDQLFFQRGFLYGAVGAAIILLFSLIIFMFASWGGLSQGFVSLFIIELALLTVGFAVGLLWQPLVLAFLVFLVYLTLVYELWVGLIVVGLITFFFLHWLYNQYNQGF